jgi:uncharacterized protein YijF (DUF1287 family)
MLGQGQQHIGIVTNLKAENYKAYLLVHSIGAGTRVENILFQWSIAFLTRVRYGVQGLRRERSAER